MIAVMSRGRSPRHPLSPAPSAAPSTGMLAAGLQQALADDAAASLAAAALARRGEVFIVGGAVRDLLLGLTPKDVDLLARGVPGPEVEELLRELPGAVKMTGRDFGVFRFRTKGAEVEIALPRRERSTGDRHTDFEVDYDHALPLTEDLVRRDFTCNAIAFDLARGEVIDPHDGRADIAAGVLRCVSASAFAEDPLRILRGLRAHARHGLIPDEATRAQMADNAERLQHLSAERIGEEWEKLLETAAPHAGMALARQTAVLGALITELDADADHTDRAGAGERALERITGASTDVDLRAAAYLSELESDYPGLARAYLGRIVWPKKRAERVAHLISCLDVEPAGDALAARRLLERLGKSEAEAFITLRAATAGEAGATARADEEAGLIRLTLAAGHATSIRELAVDGAILKDHGIPAGPELGATLRGLLARVIEEPALNDRDRLLSLVPGA